jgi:hypothetical protein
MNPALGAKEKKDTHHPQPLLLPHQTENNNNKTNKANKRQNLQPQLHTKNHPNFTNFLNNSFTKQRNSPTINQQSHKTFLPIFWQA